MARLAGVPGLRGLIVRFIDGLHRDVLTRPGAFVGTENLFATLARSNEKLTFGLEPGELPEFLTARGLSLESDLGAAEYRERYFGERARKMRGHEFYRVALARVAGSPPPANAGLA